ncbi:MAG TPA: cyclase family protein [Vicinamibacterales bacterium]|nr:cyclase family protein [Vicinamibacterales bacterium]
MKRASHIRRIELRFALFAVLTAVGALSLRAASPPAALQGVANHNATRVDFDRLMKELSNWGRWGKDDQVGAVNLITPAKRKAALHTVKDGLSVSMARKAETEQALDNPRPITRVMGGTGRGASSGSTPPDISGASDTITISYHGFVHTHMDAFCHRAYRGLMYNGMPMTAVTDTACTMGSVFAWKDGIISRGVLMDIPRLKGVEYLEPGTRIYPEDLDAWAKRAHLQIEPGDIVLIRTGRWALRDARGPYNTNQLAGLYITCAQWLRQYDAAILGSDAAEDVHPSGIDGIAEPIHALVLVAMGMPIFDNLDLEAVSKEAARRNRWEFLVTASPVAVAGATGSPLNPIATF